MSFHVLVPPSDEAAFAEAAKKVLTDAARLGMNLEPMGFLSSWASNTRVIVEKVGDEVVSMALVASGMQWTQNRPTATLLEIRGNVEGLLEFIKVMAAAIGARILIMEDSTFLPKVLEGALIRMKDNGATATVAIEQEMQEAHKGTAAFTVLGVALD